MSYSELIKNFGRIRDYMREFYVCGFKSREEYDRKSARSYDDERRRIESWLGDYMGFVKTAGGKNVFLAIDSRLVYHNPLYKAWKAKSFTDGDITLHFLIFDILDEAGAQYSLNEIMEKLDFCMTGAGVEKTFDISTVRKKLKEYVQEGLILTEKRGKNLFYGRAKMGELPGSDLLDFFSETAPCGVVGSYLLDKQMEMGGHFRFKHHYITQALDCGILCTLLDAMQKKREVTLEMAGRGNSGSTEKQVVPLRIFISVQNGRQYLMAGFNGNIFGFRLDRILVVKEGDICGEFERLRAALDRMQQNMWGVSVAQYCEREDTAVSSDLVFESVEFTIWYGTGQEYIHNRLVREKRCGRVVKIDKHRSKFTGEVLDSRELLPWIRTFLGRIISIHFSNKALEKQFFSDIKTMYRMYGIVKDGKEDVL